MSYFVKMNSVSNIFDLNRKILPHFKGKQEKFGEKNRGFVDSEFVKTCHEHVTSAENYMGDRAATQPEVIAASNVVLRVKPQVSMSLHSYGK